MSIWRHSVQRTCFLSSKCLGSRSQSLCAAVDGLHTHAGLPGMSAGTLPSHSLLRTNWSRNIPLPWSGSFLPGLLCGRHFLGLCPFLWLVGVLHVGRKNNLLRRSLLWSREGYFTVKGANYMTSLMSSRWFSPFHFLSFAYNSAVFPSGPGLTLHYL